VVDIYIPDNVGAVHVPEDCVVAGSGKDPRVRFDALFDACSVDVAAYCHWRAESAEDADDAASEVFLVAGRRLEDVPSGDAARVWLYATARRVMANQRRSRRRLEAVRERMAREIHRWPHAPLTYPEHTLVHSALANLGPRDREILLLAEWEGLTAAEIAEVMGCLAVTARGRLHRARRRFREVFAALVAEEKPPRAAAASREIRPEPNPKSGPTGTSPGPDLTAPIRKVHT
jgi:RNA polymerase sigma factor (sigma-70 family)